MNSVPKGFGGPLVDLEGAIDLHFHSFPDLFPRLADDLEVAVAARDMGFRALLYKCHYESSVSRAMYLEAIVSGVRTFGGIVLNSYVGYVNPAAVEATLRLGGRAVWMPTIDAAYHAEIHGSTGKYAAQSGGRESSEGYSVLDESGKLRSEVHEVLELVAEHDVMLATCHLSPREIVALVPAARSAGVEKISITHPFYKVPGLDLETLAELVRQGAIAEFEYCGISPMWHVAQVESVVEAIKRLGAANCILVSDGGQRHNPIAPEGLRVLAQTVYEKGIPLTDVELMIKTNPAAMLGIDTVDPRAGSEREERWRRLLSTAPEAAHAPASRPNGATPVQALTRAP
jgi:hypothetical protein